MTFGRKFSEIRNLEKQKMVKCKCGKAANFGLIDNQPISCKGCGEPYGYKDVKNKKCAYMIDDVEKIYCSTQPAFGLKGTKSGIYCSKHCPKNQGYVNIRKKKCAYVNELCEDEDLKYCEKTGMFGEEDSKILYCSDHKQPFHRDQKHKECLFCRQRAAYPSKNGKKYVYCRSHRENEDDKNSDSQKCIFKDGKIHCKKIATFGLLGTKKALYCDDHRDKSLHVDVKHPMCTFGKKLGDCGKRATFGFESNRIALFCKDHSNEKLHVDVLSRRCKFPDCYTIPCFGPAGGKVIHCINHIEDGEVNLVSKRCIAEDCETIATYGSLINRIPLFCFDHKGNCIDVKHKKCLIDGCETRPCFGNESDKIPLFCSRHSKYFHVDVTRKSCEVKNCRKKRLYGYPGFHLTHCGDHKQTGQMKNSKSKCQKDGCKEMAFFGVTFPMYCKGHKKPNHKDLINRDCKSCNLPNILDQNQLCQYCDPQNFKRVALRKQNKIKDYLDKNLSDASKYISCDKIIDGGYCGKERPDFLFDFGTFMLILEVDENQHKDRPKECEYARMINIFHSLGIKTLFIRYNPDKYRNNSNEKCTKGSERRTNLLKEINYWKENSHKIDSLCSAVYMYFDNDNFRMWRSPEDLLPRIDGLIENGEERENKKRTKSTKTTLPKQVDKNKILEKNIKITPKPKINSTLKPKINSTPKPKINSTPNPKINSTSKPSTNKEYPIIKIGNKKFKSFTEALQCEY